MSVVGQGHSGVRQGQAWKESVHVRDLKDGHGVAQMSGSARNGAFSGTPDTARHTLRHTLRHTSLLQPPHLPATAPHLPATAPTPLCYSPHISLEKSTLPPCYSPPTHTHLPALVGWALDDALPATATTHPCYAPPPTHLPALVGRALDDALPAIATTHPCYGPPPRTSLRL